MSELRAAHAEAARIYLERCRRAGDRRPSFQILSSVIPPEEAAPLLSLMRSMGRQRPGQGQRRSMVQDGYLGPRQREILRLLAAGERRRAIAATLHLSPHTVVAHLKTIRLALGAKTTAHAIALGYERGLLP